MRSKQRKLLLTTGVCLALGMQLGRAQTKTDIAPRLLILPPLYGPYSGHFLMGGRGLTKPLPTTDPVLTATAPWTMTAWVQRVPNDPDTILLAGVGDPESADFRYFALVHGMPALRLGNAPLLQASLPFADERWHHLAATFDGIAARLYVDGREAAHAPMQAGPVAAQVMLAPVETCAQLPCAHFGGRIQFTLTREALDASAVATLAKAVPQTSLIEFEEGSKPWALQVVQFAGNTAPQSPDKLPHQQAPFSAPVSSPLPPSETTLVPDAQSAADGLSADWTLSGGWMLAPAPEVKAVGSQIATPGFDTHTWMPAEVPGTVLTTMIARGKYPDPDYGLNNLDIPESLNQQDYWYRSAFATPSATQSRRHFELVLDGVNYAAEVWLNGERLGTMKGAFQRGVFDVTGKLHNATDTATNILAVRVSPAPHPGIPNEQSIAMGSGLNGGAMAIDGPTFMASEGWDWFPPMHDRDTGLWQNVRLVASGAVALGDPQVVTHLPLPDLSSADVSVSLPIRNITAAVVSGTVRVAFEGVSVQKQVTVQPGESTVTFTPADFAQLHLANPRLWWPNGYGKPELYHLQATFVVDGTVQSEKHLQFGVREVTYELSLLDNTGALRRVDYDPTIGREAKQPQVDVTHAGMRQIPDGWAASISAGDDNSPTLKTLTDTRATPYLILKVNGVRIATRGGSWGMDDTRKRISREHLEPFFRYDRDANVNIIRNWQGQNTEPIFYQLADEYGMMVWNDFWEVTQDSNAEAEDPQLFLANAKDTILRYRNHPSIVMWCGRNEGVPQPIINTGLIALTHQLDGTRYYSPSSNQVNLQPSGPYSYEDPADYYTKLDPGFAVEVGTPSLPTLEWFKRWLPAADRWPISDDWAYHNWHPNDALNQHMQAQFGAASSLEDYERKAQMMNYVDYRAIFEGFNQHLWAPNSGRLLWMTQPAWPSTLWGILSSDYDTQASYYATRKACEPVHVQLDLATNAVTVINTTRDPLPSLQITADVYDLANRPLEHATATVDAAADDTTHALQLKLTDDMQQGAVLVRLQLHAANGTLVSDNFYWRAQKDADYRALDTMPSATVAVAAKLSDSPTPSATSTRTIHVALKNTSAVASLANKLVTVYADSGEEVLPAYYSDNYVSLLPGQTDTVNIDLPADPQHRPLRLELRGWNAVKSTTQVK